MNRILENRMKKLEEKGPSGPSAIIVYAKWDEPNEDAIKASFVGPPPTDVPIYVFSEQMTLEQWLASHRKYEEDPTWSKTHGGSFYAFSGMGSAKRIRVADRPVRC
jgi:hypothetical protein